MFARTWGWKERERLGDNLLKAFSAPSLILLDS